MLRPTITSVVSMLEGKTIVDELAWDPSIYGHEWSFRAFRDQFGQNPRPSSMQNHSLIQLSIATWNSLFAKKIICKRTES